MNRITRRNLFLTALSLFLFCPVSPRAEATPLTYGDEIVKPLTWPKNSTLNIFIQQDPKAKGRDQLAKEGVERWKPVMTARGITVNVTIGDPPAGTQNEVRYTWEAENFTFADLPALALGTNDGMGVVGYSKTRLLVGKAFLHKDLPSDNVSEQLYIKNVAEHEFVHVLGLADDEKGVITHHSQPNTARDFNDQDKKELNGLYGTVNTGGDKKPKGNAAHTGGNASLGFFTYHFAFEPGNLLPDPNDPEHVSLINFGIDPRLVTAIDLPPGWIGLIPTGPLLPSDPFFQGYMEDGAGFGPSVWDPFNPMMFVALRTSPEEALLDGLSPGFDPGLTLDNVSFEIAFHTNGLGSNRPIPLWAGDELQWVTGPVVPEPSSILLLGSGLAGMAAFRRRRRA